jgi:phage protein D/phage baseplate assembly protein gpV
MPISSQCLIEVAGAALAPDIASLLTEAFVEDSQRRPDMFWLRFRDVGRAVVDKSGAHIGALVRLLVQTPHSQAPELLMAGEVTAVEAEFDATGTFTVIRGYDPAHRLFHGRRTAAYTQATASDIVTTVTRRAGLTPGTITTTNTVFDHVSQGGQTDWEFLEALAREVGFELTVREGKVSFTAPKAATGAPKPTDGVKIPLVLRLGEDLLRMRAVVTSAQQVKEVEVRGWDVTTKKALVATEPARTTTVELPDTDAQRLADVFGGATYVSTDVPHGTQAEVDAAAKSLAEEVAGSFACLEGLARGNPALAADAAVSLAGLGAPFDGKYTLTTARHRFDPVTGYTTSFVVSGRTDRSLLSLTAADGNAQRTQGLAVGIVNDIADPEGLGRVKVSLPWLSDDFVSDWARTLQLGAGKDRGWMVLPEVGDEVLVGFEQGDFRRPYVLGGLHNGVDGPSGKGVTLVDSGTGAVNRRSMVSRLGHRIDLLDESGKATGIAMATADDALTLTLDAKATKITVHSDGTILIEGGNGVVVDAASAKLELKGGQIAISGTQGVTVDGGSGNVSVKAGAQLDLKGLTAKLEGSSMTEVKGGATCAISAGLVRIN